MQRSIVCMQLHLLDTRSEIQLNTNFMSAIQLAERRQGNSAFKAGDYLAALHHYRRALAVVDFVEGQNPWDQEEVQQNKLSTLNNLAAAHLGLKQWKQAAEFCSKALEIAPDNVTAILRRAKAEIAWFDLDAAEADLAAVQRLDPFNDLLAELHQRIKQQRLLGTRKDRQICRNIFR